MKASPPSGIGRHKPAKQSQSSTAFVNFLGRFCAGELEEMRRRDEAPANWKPSPLGTEVDDRCSLGSSRWRKAPSQLRKLVRSVFTPPDYGSLVSGPDVLGGLRFGAAFRHLTGIRVWLKDFAAS